MKLFVFLLCIGLAYSLYPEDEFKCNFRTCGAELLNFEHFSISSVFKKLEMGQFCIKNCTPPVVHEFFQGVIFAITKRIPGHCHGAECFEKNRFVALSKCAEERAWPLLQCSKRLIDLAQVGLVHYADRVKRNFTCSIIVETTQCLEEKLQECGPLPFSLVKEIFVDVVRLGINAYCHPSYLDEFAVITTPLASYQDRMKQFTDIPPAPGNHPYRQYVKGYKSSPGGSSSLKSQSTTVVAVLGSLVASGLMWRQLW